MKKPSEIVAEFDKRKKITESRLRKQYSNTKRCQAFYAGDIMEYEDRVVVPTRDGAPGRAIVKFNKVKPYVNGVKGFMAQNRIRPKYDARMDDGPAQDLFSGYANGIHTYIRENANSDQVETQQDGDMLINGYGAVETALSYTEGHVSAEIDGEVLQGRLDPLSVGWDPEARATNLTDARWVYYKRQYNVKEAISLFSEAEDKDDFESSDDDPQEGMYEYFPYGGVYDKRAPLDWANQQEEMVNVYFYQWYEIERLYKMPNPLLEIDEYSEAEAQAFQVFFSALQKKYEDDNFRVDRDVLALNKEQRREVLEFFQDYPELTEDIYDFPHKTYYTAVVSGESVFTAFKSLSQNGYSIQFKTGDFNEKDGIWMGLVNSMMDPVLYYNKALTELMYTIASNSKGGVMVERSAVDDIREFEDNYNRTDGVVEVEDNAIAEGRIKEKKSPHVPTGLESLIGITDQALNDVNGFDTTFMGSREFSEDTAKYQRQRIRQVMSLLACYFDSARLYQKINARIMLDFMRIFVENNENMAVRVIGEDNVPMYLQLSKQQISAEYDIAIGQAPKTEEDRMEQGDTLAAIADRVSATNPKAGMLIYGIAIDLMPLDAQYKEKLREVLMPDEGEIDPDYVAELEAAVQQAQSEERQVGLQKVLSEVGLNEAKVREVMAKVQSERADTRKTLEEAKQKALETEFISDNNVDNVSVGL